jgi:hypothetical protein
VSRPTIAVYALARNEAAAAARWAESAAAADLRLVTDTGSSDGTADVLRGAGVTVHEAAILPWRWDVAHQASLNNVPAAVDLCIRLDLDETLTPGWRAKVEAVWAAQRFTRLLYRYRWTGDGVRPELVIPMDRIHSRDGYVWSGATHEGLVRWSGEEVQAQLDELLVLHHRDQAKVHATDMALLSRAVEESPHDARMRWYYARELDFAGAPEAAKQFAAYLKMPGGAPSERAYAAIRLSLLLPDEARLWLLRATAEDPTQPEAYCRLAYDALTKGDPVRALAWARQAVACPRSAMDHTSDARAFGVEAWRLASQAALQAGRYREAAFHAARGLKLDGDDAELRRVVEVLGSATDGPRG